MNRLTENHGTETGPTAVPVTTPELEIPTDDPFANDLMDNLSRAHALTELMKRAQTPYVISIDAEWGNGKTTFLKMLTRQLKNDGFGVIEFNAWEHDFTDNPVTTLAGEIVRQTKSFGRSNLRRRAAGLAKAAAPIATEIGAGVAASLATSNVPGAFEKTVIGILKLARIVGKIDPIFRYDSTTQGVTRFKQALKETAEEAARQHGGLPMVVAIDELDRCRPDYTIRFLETIKHFFNTPQPCSSSPPTSTRWRTRSGPFMDRISTRHNTLSDSLT